MHACIGEGNGNPLQCSCLENPRDRGAWWAAVYGVTQSRAWLKWLILYACIQNIHIHIHTHTRACTVLTSFFSVISWLLHKHHVSCLFAPVFYSDHLSPYLSLFPLLLFFCYSPLLLNLLITRLDIEVRILLCFSWLLTLYIRFRNPRHPCNQGALSLYWVNGSLSHVDRDYLILSFQRVIFYFLMVVIFNLILLLKWREAKVAQSCPSVCDPTV